MQWLTKRNIIIAVSVVGGLFLIIMLWMFADVIRDTVRAWQKSSSSQEVIAAKEQAATAKVESDNAKAIAAEALKDLAETKEQFGKQIEITKQAEARLLAANKISEASKKDYEDTKNKILNSEYHSTNPNLNTDELCERAKSLGISCE